jgi:hypothetical protein
MSKTQLAHEEHCNTRRGMVRPTSRQGRLDASERADAIGIAAYVMQAVQG